jgi:hypothetical protein
MGSEGVEDGESEGVEDWETGGLGDWERLVNCLSPKA